MSVSVRTRPPVVLALLAALVACGRSGSHEPPPPKVTVARPIERTLFDWDEYTARLESVESVEVRPRVSGYLQAVNFAEGGIVQKGDCLFQIDPRPYDAALRRAQGQLELARARLELARKNLARAEPLLRTQAMSKEEAETRAAAVRQNEAEVAAAEADVESARLDVEFTRITAPIGGRVGRRLVTQGNLITGGVGTQGTLLTTIVSLDPLYAYFDADERSYLKYVRLGQRGERPSSREYKNPVLIGLADEPGFPHEGWMDFVDNRFDPGTGTMIGRAVVPNPDLTMSPGQFARLRLAGSGTYTALLIPDEAVQSDQAQKFVWVVDGENRARYRIVTLGTRHDGLRVIREGLAPDDRVIVKGVQRAHADQPVDPEEAPPEEPPATAPTPATG